MYTGFASVYDIFMDDIPYKAWAEDMRDILKEHNITGGIVAELGCGTGNLTQELTGLGYDMIGIDSSYDMLDIAMSKREEKGLDILYLCQDIRSFELYGTCAAIVSRCDTFNYLLEYEDLVNSLKLVNNYLDPKGLFIFDLNSMYKYKQILADNTIAENRENESFIWENYYDEETNLNSYELSVFVREDDDRYIKYEEQHIQRAYSLYEIKDAIKEAGLELLSVSDADTKKEADEFTQRYLIVARESGK